MRRGGLANAAARGGRQPQPWDGPAVGLLLQIHPRASLEIGIYSSTTTTAASLASRIRVGFQAIVDMRGHRGWDMDAGTHMGRMRAAVCGGKHIRFLISTLATQAPLAPAA